MTLSGWFRDYVYIPLGGNRNGVARYVRNLLVVWLLTGLWHGAGWNFILWGLLYFCLILIEHLVKPKKALPKFLGHIYTLFFVNLLWILFRSGSITAAFTYLRYFFGLGGNLISADSVPKETAFRRHKDPAAGHPCTAALSVMRRTLHHGKLQSVYIL